MYTGTKHENISNFIPGPKSFIRRILGSPTKRENWKKYGKKPLFKSICFECPKAQLSQFKCASGISDSFRLCLRAMKKNVLATPATWPWLWSQGTANSPWEWFSDEGSQIGKPLQLVDVVHLLISLELKDELLKKATLWETHRGRIAKRPD